MGNRRPHRRGGRPGSSLISRLSEDDLAKPIGLGGSQKVGDLMTTRVDPGEKENPARCALRTVDGKRWEGICMDEALQSCGAAQTSENRTGYGGRIREGQAAVGGAAEENLFVEVGLGNVGDENLSSVSCQHLRGLQRLSPGRIA